MMPVGLCIDELGCNAHTVCCPAYATLKYIAHPQLTADLFHICGSTLIGEAGVTRDDKQLTKPRERRNDFFYDAVGKIVLFRIAAHIGERKNCNRGLVRKRRSRIRLLHRNFSRCSIRPLFTCRANETKTLARKGAYEAFLFTTIVDGVTRSVNARA